jgi:hypothetical protein
MFQVEVLLARAAESIDLVEMFRVDVLPARAAESIDLVEMFQEEVLPTIMVACSLALMLAYERWPPEQVHRY